MESDKIVKQSFYDSFFKVAMIPRIIHQIWLGPLEPPAKAMQTWVKLHPAWEYRLWTEKNIPQLKNQKAFDASDNYPQKSDILRYELLANMGGVYVDADEYCIKAIDQLVADNESTGLIAAYEGSLERPDLVANTVMACAANNGFMQNMVAEIDINKAGGAWELTGPQYLTDMLVKHDPSITILPAKHFYPIHHRDKEHRKIDLKLLALDSDVYGVHLWTGTKRAYKPIWYKNPFKYLFFRVREGLNKTFRVINED